MLVENMLEPDTSRAHTLKPVSEKESIYLVNLLKFREHAQYPDARDSELSGKQAYERYMEVIYTLLPQYDAEVVFCGDVTGIWLGHVETLWDEVLIVKYGSRQQMFDMGGCETWQAASEHRTAGLEGQLNIETVHDHLATTKHSSS